MVFVAFAARMVFVFAELCLCKLFGSFSGHLASCQECGCFVPDSGVRAGGGAVGGGAGPA
eukprot:3642304-Rhodomonas_salina.4